MSGFSTPILIGAGISLVVWIVTLALVVAALRTTGRRAVVLAAVAFASRCSV
jgi:hypothetical protein